MSYSPLPSRGPPSVASSLVPVSALVDASPMMQVGSQRHVPASQEQFFRAACA